MVSGQSSIEAFSTAKTLLLRVVTTNFYNSHVALVDSPTYKAHLGNANRPIDASSCIMATRTDVNRLVSIVNARCKAGVQSRADNPDRSILYDSGQYFEFVTWDASGKGSKVSARFTYSMLRDKNRWHIHHLESISVAGHDPQAVLSPSELASGYESDQVYTSDYEDDEYDEDDEWD
jgi:hypothetical protein